jgi:hypothetical protein
MFCRENSFRSLQAVLHQALSDAASLDVGAIIGKYACVPRERGAIWRCAAGVIRCCELERGLGPAIRRLHHEGLRELYGCSLETFAGARVVVA